MRAGSIRFGSARLTVLSTMDSIWKEGMGWAALVDFKEVRTITLELKSGGAGSEKSKRGGEGVSERMEITEYEQ